MIIRNATEKDIPDVIRIHLKAFDGFFLSLLGPSFLRLLYVSFMNMDSGVMRVIENDNLDVIGFAAGTTTPQIFFSQLRKEKWLQFALSALPGMLRNPVIVTKKLYHALTYKGDKPANLDNAALLSSIAVLPEFSGKSIGKKLLNDYELKIKEKGSNLLYLTTDKFGNDNVVSFYKRCGYQIDSEFKQPNQRLMLRLTKYL